MDIDLSIERSIAYQHVLCNRTILKDHTYKKKVSSIPKLVMPPYLINFGYVIFGNIVHYTCLLLNYGPIHTFVRLLPLENEKQFTQKGKLLYTCVFKI